MGAGCGAEPRIFLPELLHLWNGPDSILQAEGWQRLPRSLLAPSTSRVPPQAPGPASGALRPSPTMHRALHQHCELLSLEPGEGLGGQGSVGASFLPSENSQWRIRG